MRHSPEEVRRARSPGRGWLCAYDLFCPSDTPLGYGANPPGALVSNESGALIIGNANCVTRACGQGLDEVGKSKDADATQSKLCRHFLHVGLRPLTAFLAIERERHARGGRAGRADDFNGFANGGTRRDHVIDDDDATTQRTADNAPALSVVLRFLAVEGPW